MRQQITLQNIGHSFDLKNIGNILKFQNSKDCDPIT
jgi:hypothetical protein